MEMFNLKKLNDLEGKEWYHVEMSNGFAALKNLDTEVMLIKLVKLLERISKFLPKRVSVIMN
jgi:hypothetical protein